MDITNILKKSFSDNIVDLKILFYNKIDYLGLTKEQAQKTLGMGNKILDPILDGSIKQPNVFNIIKLASFLEIDIEDIIIYLVSKQDPEQVNKLEQANNLTFITKHFDIDRLTKAKLIQNKSDTELILDRILSFLGFKNITEYEKFSAKYQNILFSKTKRTHEDKMREFAILSAYRIFQIADNPNKYNREDLKNLIKKMKPYCQDVKNGLINICRLLYNIGVTVSIQTHLTTSQYRGATFVVNNKPCIVLTDLNKMYPTMWFALLHELYHVLFDLETIERQGYHLTGQPDMFLVNESAADNFAQDYFFDEKMYRQIAPNIHNEYIVNNYAKKHSIHPSFVYRGFQYFISEKEGRDYWRAFSGYFPKVEIATKGLSPLVWEKDTIPEKALELKKIFELEIMP